MLKIIRIFSASIFFLLTLLLFTNNTKAATVIFQDDFEDNTIFDKWNYISGAWNTESFLGSIWAYTNSGPVTDNEIQANNSTTWNNYEFSLDVYRVSGSDINLFFRIQNGRYTNLPWHNLPIGYGLHLKDGRFALQKFTQLTGSEIGNIANESFPAGSLKKVKIRLDGNNIKVYTDNGTLPIIDYTDNDNPFLSGGIALAAITGADSSYVRYDNISVSELPIPTPTPTPTPVPTIGPFELPFSYSGRLGESPTQFKNAFWDKMRALFDHVYQTGVLRPFTGNTYTSCSDPISCYDSHNGTDFSGSGNQNVYSVASGRVVYASSHDLTSCNVDAGGFGCAVIVKYTGNHYGLFAHLEKVYVNESQNILISDLIGQMGNTGCYPCFEHLHFGVLRPIKNAVSLLNAMTRKDWQGLLVNIRPSSFPTYPPACTYSAPNGAQFYFQDPSGWRGAGPDPWGQPKNKGGCGINSPYLWKYDIGTGP